MDKAVFINSIKEGALQGYKNYNVLPSLTIAQAILESGWGTSQLAIKAKNLFGIKAFSDWKGKRITIQTTEWYKGKKQVVSADFRAYDSYYDSIMDHNKLLATSRYEPVRKCKEYKEACESVYKCGYATDPEYAQKLISIIEQNKLYQYDNVSLNEAAADNDSEKIRKFQGLCNSLGIRDYEGKELVEDNILGPRTKICIKKMPLLKRGSKGAAVSFVQQLVGAVPVDGDFGPITEGCVKDYQRRKGLKVDGIVGVKTWTSLVTT
ncbi:MAG: hypothetical protein GX895_07100 [Clostridiales bacterium]|uniref:glucosaminidase domain-containing protein n=1 Tax=Clostridium sp. N3C TaxID=1776758 RepID=UPI00092DEEB1|nr:glucosaminidase domain-containing protein [Clostridium sp. N3C]NLZ48543.1 hypothetical protein [Clostridiales bacterium]SCN23530.1 Exo-glucosaminidase LytG precursor [Clostridium sp. N3C]